MGFELMISNAVLVSALQGRRTCKYIRDPRTGELGKLDTRHRDKRGIENCARH